jgi:hypothetical protein
MSFISFSGIEKQYSDSCFKYELKFTGHKYGNNNVIIILYSFYISRLNEIAGISYLVFNIQININENNSEIESHVFLPRSLFINDNLLKQDLLNKTALLSTEEYIEDTATHYKVDCKIDTILDIAYLPFVNNDVKDWLIKVLTILPNLKYDSYKDLINHKFYNL